MKSVVWGLILLLSIVSVSAAFFPEPGITFGFRGAKCLTNGSMILNITHEGNNIAFKDINLTAESESVSPVRLIGEYVYPDFFPIIENYTGNDFFGKSRMKFRTTNNIFTKGKYIVTLSWNSNTIYSDKIKFAVECPGIKCSSDNDCISQQQCLNQTCEWTRCPSDKFATGNTCLPKCEDYNPCTSNYFINNQCVFVKIENCPKAEENNVEPNLFTFIWNWLKSRY